jgi:phytoene dehydrogenase-like protein
MGPRHMLTRRHLLRSSLVALTAITASCCERGVPGSVPGRLLDSGASLGHRLRDGKLPPVSQTRQARVVIAGAGIAGLAAARSLRAARVEDVLMIDALETVGGNSSFGQNAVSAYPWGAHYVPLARKDCLPVVELFRDLKIIVDEDAQGRPVYDEYCLSADPQERLWQYGRWQEGLVPQLGSTARDRAEFTTFFAATETLKSRLGSDGKPVFAIPLDASSADPAWRALDSISITEYLRRLGYQSPLLHWYVNYCCRDDYGTQAAAISAWAGLHYFAARNGVAANADPTTVVTWPEGNGHLARELTRQGGAKQQCNALVTRVARDGTGVVVEYFDAALSRTVRVEAAAAIVCLPRFVASRVVEGLGSTGVADFSYAPWMVANLTLSQLPGGRGQALAWDNVIFDSPLLGYVVATHQGLEQTRRDTVITYYWPLSDQEPPAARKTALGRSLEDWQGHILRDLLRVHPELQMHVENIDVRVWGHAMIRPTPGFLWGASRQSAGAPRPPIYFAHSDLSGISIFEEAYCRGHEAGRLAAELLTEGAAHLST